MASLWAVCGVLTLTFWVTINVGFVLLLARWIGMVSAVFVASGLTLASGAAVLLVIRNRLRAARQARAEARRLLMTTAMAILPAKKMTGTVVAVAGLIALSFFLNSGNDGTDDGA